jgi:serine phosphatase RsbU (regulator of sigma subunit)
MAEHSILIVEDDSTVRELLKYRLNKKYDVATAANGEEALEQIEQKTPHLIISDIMMPKMDGFALQSELQADKNTRVIPFIFLTARADEPTRREGARMGVDDYITKPFDMEQLLNRIERLLERMQVFQTQLDAEIGRDFSQRLLPKHMPEVDGYRIQFHSHAREQGGGDLFDWTKMDDGTYFITIGDVMGKGIRAKFYAYSFLSYVRGTLHTLLQESTSPAEIMSKINEMLLTDEVLEDTFASFLLFRWDPSEHTVTYSNAGHCRPVVITPEKTALAHHSNLILGLEANAEFDDETIELKPDTALLAYTDGLLEHPVDGHEVLGEEGILDIAGSSLGADDPIAALLDQALSRGPSTSFHDDVLIFWMQREE